MATQVQFRRGTTAQNNAFTGVVGETTYDTDLQRLVTHDGVLAGGFPTAMLHLAQTFAATQSITPAANTSALISSGQSVTGANTTSLFDLAATWNTTGAPSAIKLNVTDTASAATGTLTGPFLLNLQKDGITRFGFRKDGTGEFLRQEADTAQGGLEMYKRGTTGNATAALSSGSGIASLGWDGWDGAAYGSAGHIRMFTTEAWTGIAHGSKLFFSTVPIGTVTSTVAATLDDTSLTVSSRLLLPNTTSALLGGVYFGGNRAFHNFGTNNTFAGVNAGNFTLTGTNITAFGVNAGLATTSGGYNSFFGRQTGALNTTGASNSFFGSSAGALNTTANSNSFFGHSAGAVTSTGSFNAFFGRDAGLANTTGYYNSFFGRRAGQANISGHDNSFFGLNAGALNTANNNSFFGSAAGDANTTGTLNSFFGINSGGANIGGGSNSFFGASSGLVNTSGIGNAFFGTSAGAGNISGNNNAFFGNQAGIVNTAGYNCFFGAYSGLVNTSGSQNCFSGFNTGKANIAGASNTFFGSQAGLLSTVSYNSFFGRSAGAATTTGPSNCFFGHNAGLLNATGQTNSFFGKAAGDNLTSGNNNIVIGANIDVPSSTGSNLLTIGNLIFGTGVDGVGLGISTGNVGIAVITPTSGLHLGRSFATPYRAIAATDTFAASDYTINATSGTFTVNLPTAVGITGRIYVLKNSGVGTLTLDPAGAELIDGAATSAIVSGASITTQSTGAGWIII